MGIYCFIRTPLIAGDVNVPNFILPLLEVDSVGESLANAVYSGYGSTIYMPDIINRLAVTLVSIFCRELALFLPFRFLTMTVANQFLFFQFQRGGPEWIFRLVREGTINFGIDFRGRHQLDAVTGKLQKA